jgi:conjugative relaxase-like TrwC/TraI family protein
VLSIGKLVAGAEDYYLNTVARGREEYYTGAGEAPGRWMGEGCARLGFSGDVAAGDLAALLAGRAPSDGAPLTTAVPSRARRVAGFDLTFSAPKSVSVLYGLGPSRVARAVTAAHDAAVTDALCYLERHATFARRGHAGERSIETAGLVGAAFRHRTSRAGEPQLHTHVLVANAVLGTDGRWSALYASLLYHHARTAGFVYQAALRAGLVESLGVQFGPVRNGTAEVKGIDQRLTDVFSTRRKEVKARLSELGTSSKRSAELAALETRPAKGTSQTTAAGLESLRASWWRRAEAAGLDPVSVLLVVGRPRAVVVSREESAGITTALLGAEGLTAQVSAFERRDAVRGVAERLAEGGRLSAIEAVADDVLNSREVVSLDKTGAGGELLRTTRELLALEADLLATADSRTSTGVAIAETGALSGALAERPSLRDEQLEMVSRLTSSGDGVQVAIGKAGAGKTFALDAARAAWEQSGMRVQGAALAARAAAELFAGAGIVSTTLAGVFHGIDRGELVFGAQDILVVDEAGMVGTRDLHRVVKTVSAAGAKVVLVGDPRQLPEIAAGGALAALVERLGAVQLSDNRRQEASWERAALDELRHGDAAVAVRAYEDHGRVHLSPSSEHARRALVADWAASASDGNVARMYAPRRADVEDLNERARAELRRRGVLEADLIISGDRGFAEGDEVLCLRNDRRLRVLNGTRGVVRGASDGSLLVDTEAGRRTLSADYLEAGHVAHGYASTIHKAQGATVDRAFVLGSEACYREAGYVAMSRARVGTNLYVVTAAFEDGRGPDVSSPALTPFVEALSSSRAKTLALDHLGGAAVFDGRHLAELADERDRLRRNVSSRLPADPAPYHAALEADCRRIAAASRPTSTRTPSWVVAAEARLGRDAYRVAELEKARDSFARTHARSLERLGELVHLTTIGPRLLGEAAAIDPPPHLIDLLGPPPEFANERPRWIAAAGAVEVYRQRAGLGREVDRLGRRPSEEPARSAYDEVLAVVVSYDQRRGRAIGGTGREPGRDMAL